MISEEDYENVKKFYILLKMSNLGELNKIYNFQDTMILCEIFEQRSDLLKGIFKYNPSSFSGYVHCNKSKCCIALPTDANFVRVFEKALIGGFSCVNTRLAFYSDILLRDPDKEKVLIELNINEKKELKRFSSKILKQDWQAMTQPLPYACIKKQDKVLSLTEFSKMLDSISHEDNIGHLFAVDIKFHKINEKTLLFNELYSPILEKKLILLKGQHCKL